MMKNKIGVTLFTIGFLGICFGIMALDGTKISIALMIVLVSFLIATVGYLLTDVDEVVEGAGFQKVRESKIIQMRKAKNREQVWNFWIATK